jgi:hypothetical protein
MVAIGGVAMTSMAVDAGRGIVGYRLSGHLATSMESAKLTSRQAAAVLRRPQLERAFMGERIDTLFKARVSGDYFLRPLVRVTPRFVRGPDVQSRLGAWWDVTTARAWDAHVQRYQPTYGHGIPGLFWR